MRKSELPSKSEVGLNPRYHPNPSYSQHPRYRGKSKSEILSKSEVVLKSDIPMLRTDSEVKILHICEHELTLFCYMIYFRWKLAEIVDIVFYNDNSIY